MDSKQLLQQLKLCIPEPDGSIRLEYVGTKEEIDKLIGNLDELFLNGDIGPYERVDAECDMAQKLVAAITSAKNISSVWLHLHLTGEGDGLLGV